MQFRFTIIFIALCAVFLPATGQNEAKNGVVGAVSCKDSKDLINTDLFGAWTLELKNGVGAANTTRITLERNPEFAESLAGHFLQGTVRHEVFGDIEAGAVDLEESNNGKDIIALWKGRVVDGSCGQAVTGTRRSTVTQAEESFVLRRTGW